MEIAFLIGRILVAFFHLLNAANHFSQSHTLSQYAASKGVPIPRVAVLVSGLLLLVGGLSILTGFQPTVGVLALVLFYLAVTFKMHNFWAIKDEMARMGEMVNFMKNLAIMGSALMFLAIPQPWQFSLGG